MKPGAGVKHLCLVGATGLVGRTVIESAISRSDVRIRAVARREMELPPGARMEMVLAPVEGWPAAIAATRAQVLVCALGTTMKAVGGDRDAFRAVDHDLVLAAARAAKDAGIEHVIAVSSVGADTGSSNFYLRTKGETEAGLAKLGFARLDILRPGLLLGPRRESRALERFGQMFAPLLNLFLHGSWRQYRAIRAATLAEAIFALSHARARGRFVHDFDSMQRAIRRAGD